MIAGGQEGVARYLCHRKGNGFNQVNRYHPSKSLSKSTTSRGHSFGIRSRAKSNFDRRAYLGGEELQVFPSPLAGWETRSLHIESKHYLSVARHDDKNTKNFAQ